MIDDDTVQQALVSYANRLRAVGVEATREDYFRTGCKFGAALARSERVNEVALLKAQVEKLKSQVAHLDYQLSVAQNSHRYT